MTFCNLCGSSDCLKLASIPFAVVVTASFALASPSSLLGWGQVTLMIRAQQLVLSPLHYVHHAVGFLRDRKNHDSQRRDRILRFFLRPEIGQFFPRFGAISLLHNTEKLEEKEKSTGENSKNPVETALRNCRFLFLVVVECALIFQAKTSC